MSRIGKLPVEIPQGVDAKIDGQRVAIKGPKGLMTLDVNPRVKVSLEGKSLSVQRSGDDREERSLHGLTRALVANMVKGVTSGFERNLTIIGIGYKAQLQGKKLLLNLGYSHPIEFPIPEGITAVVDAQTQVKILGADKQKVGQVAAEIRKLRPVEPYKGKGIRYSDEVVRQKEGKAASK